MTTLTQDQILDQLNNMDSDTLFSVWGEYVNECGDASDMVFPNYEQELNMTFPTVAEAVRAVSCGDYNYSDDFFTFNGYGNVVSFNYADDDNSPVDLPRLADWVEQNFEAVSQYFDIDETEEGEESDE